jgi:hypothetical protein
VLLIPDRSQNSFYSSNKSSARCNNFSSLLLDDYLQLNMFQASSCPSSGAQQLAAAASGFTFGVL